jgi:hypothetical protein
MSNADRLRSGPGLPLSARLVNRAAEQRAPFTSPHTSLALTGQWIRSDTRRYTLKGAASRDLNFIPPTATAPSISKTTSVPVKVLQNLCDTHRLQKSCYPAAGALHHAPQSVRTSLSAANIHQTQVPSHLVACSQHAHYTSHLPRQATPPQTTPIPLSTHGSTTMSSSLNPPPTYKQVLLWDPPQHGRFTDIHHPRNTLAGHPLTPFLSTTQLPRPQQVLGTASDPLPLHRGLQTPLVLSVPQSTAQLGTADDLSTRMIDTLLLTGQYSTNPPPPCPLLASRHLPARPVTP